VALAATAGTAFLVTAGWVTLRDGVPGAPSAAVSPLGAVIDAADVRIPEAAPVLEIPPVVTLEPADDIEAEEPALEPFDRNKAHVALERAATRARACSQPKTRKLARVAVTFAPDGTVERVHLYPGPYKGKPAGRCIKQAFLEAKVAPFKGKSVTLFRKLSLFVAPETL
jgi:hypothetical protein